MNALIQVEKEKDVEKGWKGWWILAGASASATHVPTKQW